MVQTVSPREAHALMEKGDIDVIDVRDVREWARGHIPAARLVPLDEFQANPSASQQKEVVVFVCAKGSRSLTAAKLADRYGFARVYNLQGGTAAWERAGLPLERT